VFANSSYVFAEQRSHLRLIEPNSISVKRHFEVRVPISGNKKLNVRCGHRLIFPLVVTL